MLITIDGTSGTGKSTIAKEVAKALGFTHVDTGAIYRSLAWAVLNKGFKIDDAAGIEEVLSTFNYDVREDKRIFVNETDVTDLIRTNEISLAASSISTHPFVRKSLVQIQRKLGEKNSVFEGRDMGSVVFPHADLKIFLMASSSIRAERRLKELREKFPDKTFDYETILLEMSQRDERDMSREISPLVCPKDALIIDTSKLTIEEVKARVLSFYKRLMKKRIAYRMPGVKFLYRITIFICHFFLKFFYRHKVYGLEHYFRGGGIIASTHASFLDPPIVSCSWPEEVHFLARGSLFNNRAFAKLIEALNTHPISGEVSDIAIFKEVQKLISQGKKVILFPEGSRSVDGELMPIKPGIAFIAMRAKVPITPTYIDGAFEIWHRGSKLPRLRGKTACVFGSPIRFSQFEGLPKREAMEAITSELEKSIQGLRDWHKAGAKGTPP